MLRILIVDDLADSAESLATMLRLRGHETCVAARGGEAVDKAVTFQPNVLLADIAMPGMGGLEVARRIRALPGLGSVVVAAVSGFDGEETRHEAWAAGIEHYLVKPVDPEALFAMIDAYDWEAACPTQA